MFPIVCTVDHAGSSHKSGDTTVQDDGEINLQCQVLNLQNFLYNIVISARVSILNKILLNCRNCFVKNLHNEGLMEDAEYTVLTEWFDFARETMPMKVDLIGNNFQSSSNTNKT